MSHRNFLRLGVPLCHLVPLAVNHHSSYCSHKILKPLRKAHDSFSLPRSNILIRRNKNNNKSLWQPKWPIHLRFSRILPELVKLELINLSIIDHLKRLYFKVHLSNLSKYKSYKLYRNTVTKMDLVVIKMEYTHLLGCKMVKNGFKKCLVFIQ